MFAIGRPRQVESHDSASNFGDDDQVLLLLTFILIGEKIIKKISFSVMLCYLITELNLQLLFAIEQNTSIEWSSSISPGTAACLRQQRLQFVHYCSNFIHDTDKLFYLHGILSIDKNLAL